jgi:hypothetical protein
LSSIAARNPAAAWRKGRIPEKLQLNALIRISVTVGVIRRSATATDGTDLADITEQFLEEVAVAAGRGRPVFHDMDHRDLFKSGRFHGGDVAAPVETDVEDFLR